eukprot:6127458-Amphidinium_carterae.1
MQLRKPKWSRLCSRRQSVGAYVFSAKSPFAHFVGTQWMSFVTMPLCVAAVGTVTLGTTMYAISLCKQRTPLVYGRNVRNRDSSQTSKGPQAMTGNCADPPMYTYPVGTCIAVLPMTLWSPQASINEVFSKSPRNLLVSSRSTMIYEDLKCSYLDTQGHCSAPVADDVAATTFALTLAQRISTSLHRDTAQAVGALCSPPGLARGSADDALALFPDPC